VEIFAGNAALFELCSLPGSAVRALPAGEEISFPYQLRIEEWLVEFGKDWHAIGLVGVLLAPLHLKPSHVAFERHLIEDRMATARELRDREDHHANVALRRTGPTGRDRTAHHLGAARELLQSLDSMRDEIGKRLGAEESRPDKGRAVNVFDGRKHASPLMDAFPNARIRKIFSIVKN